MIDSPDFVKLAFKNGATKYFISNYPIEEDMAYRRYILPLMEDLLTNENQKENRKLISSFLAVIMKKEGLTQAKKAKESEDTLTALTVDFDKYLADFNKQFQKKMK